MLLWGVNFSATARNLQAFLEKKTLASICTKVYNDWTRHPIHAMHCHNDRWHSQHEAQATNTQHLMMPSLTLDYVRGQFYPQRYHPHTFHRRWTHRLEPVTAVRLLHDASRQRSVAWLVERPSVCNVKKLLLVHDGKMWNFLL